MRPNIVGGRQIEFFTSVLDQPWNESVALLRRRRPGAEQERRAFLSFVQLGINVKCLAAINDGVLDGVTHGTRDATEHHVNLVLCYQLAHFGYRELFIRGRVFEDHLQWPAEQASALVNVIDDHFCNLRIWYAAPADCTSQVGRDADLDGVGCPSAFRVVQVASTTQRDHSREQTGTL